MGHALMHRAPEITELWYEGFPVARVKSAFESDDTWYAVLDTQPSADDLGAQGRVAQYVAFCVDWHVRLEAGESPDAEEFDRYRDVTRAGAWAARGPSGVSRAIENAPVFTPGGEVTWRLA